MKEMKVAISEKWEIFMEKDYKKCIARIHSYCKPVIKAKSGFFEYQAVLIYIEIEFILVLFM